MVQVRWKTSVYICVVIVGAEAFQFVVIYQEPNRNDDGCYGFWNNRVPDAES